MITLIIPFIRRLCQVWFLRANHKVMYQSRQLSRRVAMFKRAAARQQSMVRDARAYRPEARNQQAATWPARTVTPTAQRETGQGAPVVPSDSDSASDVTVRSSEVSSLAEDVMNEAFEQRLERTVHRMLRDALSAPTRRHRKSITEMFEKFCERREVDQTQKSAMRFLALKLLRPRPSGKKRMKRSILQYGSVIKLHLISIGCPVDQLVQFIKGLRRWPENEPPSQALPMLPEIILNVLKQRGIPNQLKALLWLTYATASRVSDVINMKRQAVRITPRGLLVVFTNTKTNQEAVPRVDHLALIPMEVVPEVISQFLAKTPPQNKMFTLTPSQVAAALKKISMPSKYVDQFVSPQRKVKSHFTLHSMKRGAITVLWSKAAEGQIGYMLIPTIAKHKTLVNMQVPETTVRYAARLEDVAAAVQLPRMFAALW